MPKSQCDLLSHLGPITLKNPWSIFKFDVCHCDITFTRFSTTDCFDMERLLANFRAIKQSSSQQTNQYLFWVRSTKTRKSNIAMAGVFF